MKTTIYDIGKVLSQVPWEALAPALESASDTLARLDERLAATPDLADGYRERAHFYDVCASAWLDGDLVHIEELVLHDAAMDVRAPTHELTIAASALRMRRMIARSGREWAVSRPGLASLCGYDIDDAPSSNPAAEHSPSTSSSPDQESELLANIDAVLARSNEVLANHKDGLPPPKRPHRDELIYDPDWDETARLDDWKAIVDATAELPAPMSAALCHDAWLALRPLQHDFGLARLLSAAVLRALGKTQHHLFPISLGIRYGHYRHHTRHRLETRIRGYLEGIETGARRGLDELKRLHLAQELMMRHCKGRRRNSKLPQLVDLFLKSPLVSVPMASKMLKVSPQAVETMLSDLGGSLPKELTGRSRYRAWGIL